VKSRQAARTAADQMDGDARDSEVLGDAVLCDVMLNDPASRTPGSFLSTVGGWSLGRGRDFVHRRLVWWAGLYSPAL
jgi:hypothetical protein